MKLSMKYDACNGYVVVNIKSWSCVHMHFTRYCSNINWGGWSSYLHMYHSL